MKEQIHNYTMSKKCYFCNKKGIYNCSKSTCNIALCSIHARNYEGKKYCDFHYPIHYCNFCSMLAIGMCEVCNIWLCKYHAWKKNNKFYCGKHRPYGAFPPKPISLIAIQNYYNKFKNKI